MLKTGPKSVEDRAENVEVRFRLFFFFPVARILVYRLQILIPAGGGPVTLGEDSLRIRFLP